MKAKRKLERLYREATKDSYSVKIGNRKVLTLDAEDNEDAEKQWLLIRPSIGEMNPYKIQKESVRKRRKEAAYSDKQLDSAIKFILDNKIGNKNDVSKVLKADPGALIQLALDKGWKESVRKRRKLERLYREAKESDFKFKVKVMNLPQAKTYLKRFNLKHSVIQSGDWYHFTIHDENFAQMQMMFARHINNIAIRESVKRRRKESAVKYKGYTIYIDNHGDRFMYYVSFPDRKVRQRTGTKQNAISLGKDAIDEYIKYNT